MSVCRRTSAIKVREKPGVPETVPIVAMAIASLCSPGAAACVAYLVGDRESQGPPNGSDGQTPSMSILEEEDSDDDEGEGLHWNQVDGGELGIRLFGAAVCALLVTMTLVGNVLVLLVVFKFRRLRSVTNMLLASLATADITVASLVMPFSIVYDMERQWRFGPIACHLWISCDVMCCTASILHLCVIALDRFWAITRPLRYRTFVSKKRIGFVIGGVWLCSAAISFIPIFMGWYSDGPVSIFEYSSQCSLRVNHIYATVSSLTSFYLPLPIMFYVYFRILMVAEHQAREIKQLEMSLQGAAGSHGIRRSLRRRSRQVVTDTKAIRTLGIVMGVFCVCWLPFFLMYVILAYCTECYLSYEIRSAITWLGYFNSSFNPCIYAFLNRDFKEAFRVVLCCRQTSSTVDEVSTTSRNNLRMDRLQVDALTPEPRSPCLSPQMDHVSWPSDNCSQYPSSPILLTVPSAGVKNHVSEHFL